MLAPDDLADAVIALATLRRHSTATPPPPPPPCPPSSSSSSSIAAAPITASASPSSAAATPAPGAGAGTLAAAAATAAARSAARARQRLLAVLLSGSATKLSLLRNEQLVGMAAALAEMDVRPHAGWLTALLEETQNRLAAAATAATAATAAAAGPASDAAAADTAATGPVAAGARGEAGEATSATSTSSAPAAVATASPAHLPPRLLTQLLVAIAKMDAGLPPAAWLRAYMKVRGPTTHATCTHATCPSLWSHGINMPCLIYNMFPSPETSA